MARDDSQADLRPAAGSISRLVLMGGDEFRPNCEAMDRALLAAAGSAQTRVVIIPTAAAGENPHRAARNGVHYFQRLGAVASACMILTRSDAENPHLVQELRGADLLYLAGGDPAYLLETIKNTPAWATILEQYRSGAMVVGSSAGAMVLAEKMRTRGSGWTNALGLAAGVAVLPHGESLSDALVASLRRDLGEEITLFRINTATCCLRSGEDTWRVLGIGRVAVHQGSEVAAYRSGEVFFGRPSLQ